MRPPQDNPTRQAVSSATPNSSIRGAPLAITSAASSTTAPSTQPPDTEPRKFPSASMTRCEPIGRGAEPHVSSCFPPRFRGGKDVFVSGQHSNTSLIDTLKREEPDLTRARLATGPCER